MSADSEQTSKERYHNFQPLGSGGMGAVFKARDSRLGRTVAVKRIHAAEAEALAQIRQEATVLASLNHPNILTVLDIGSDEQGSFIVTEMLEGEDLSQMIERAPLGYEDFRELALQTLEALAVAHSHQVLHRDIKPENIRVLRLPGGRLLAKVIDFGLARVVNIPRKQTTSEEGTIQGTLYYMAPEQLNHQCLDQRMDLYALGCVFYLALCGVRPFQSPDVLGLIQMICNHQVMPLHTRAPHLAPWLCGWVHQLMAFDPLTRFPDASAAIQNFRWLEKSVTYAVPVAPAWLPPQVEVGRATTSVNTPAPAQAVPEPEKTVRPAKPPVYGWKPGKRFLIGTAAAALVITTVFAMNLRHKDDPPFTAATQKSSEIDAAPPSTNAASSFDPARLVPVMHPDLLIARYVAETGIELGPDRSGKGAPNRVCVWKPISAGPAGFLPLEAGTSNSPVTSLTRGRGRPVTTWVNCKPPPAPGTVHARALRADLPWLGSPQGMPQGFTVVMVVVPGSGEQMSSFFSLDTGRARMRLIGLKNGTLRVQTGQGANRHASDVPGLDLSRPCIVTLTLDASRKSIGLRTRTDSGQRHAPAPLVINNTIIKQLNITLGSSEPPSSGWFAEILVYPFAMEPAECAVNENRLQEFYFGIKAE